MDNYNSDNDAIRSIITLDQSTDLDDESSGACEDSDLNPEFVLEEGIKVELDKTKIDLDEWK